MSSAIAARCADSVSVQRRRDAGRLDAVAMEPVADVGDTASGGLDFVVMGEFDDVNPLAGLEDRQGVRDRAPRLARILPANQSPRQFEPGRAGRRHEDRAPGAHDEIADLDFGRRGEHPLARFDGGDNQVRCASLVGDLLGRRSSRYLRAPLKIVHPRQRGPEFRFDSGRALAKSFELAAARLAGADGDERGMQRQLPCGDADDGGGKTPREVGHDRQQLGVGPIRAHTRQKSRNGRQPILHRRRTRAPAAAHRFETEPDAARRRPGARIRPRPLSRSSATAIASAVRAAKTGRGPRRRYSRSASGFARRRRRIKKDLPSRSAFPVGYTPGSGLSRRLETSAVVRHLS